MKRVKTQTNKQRKNLRPKHRHTKEYLKHYYPFLPMLASIGFLLMVLFSPLQTRNKAVLGTVTSITPPALLDATNAQRQKVGKTNLVINPRLQQAAQNKAQDMIRRDYWSHKTPEGSDPWIFVDNENYQYSKAGENLAYGFDDSTSVILGWMRSASHRQNLLDNDFTEVGFGVASSGNFNTSGASTVVVALYAKPLPPTNGTTSNKKTNILGESKTILSANLLTKSSWSAYVVIFIVGLAICYLVVVHSKNLKKALKKGEKFVIRHPLLDSAVICLISFGVLLLRSAGQIH